MTMPAGTSTLRVIWDFLSTGRKLATIGSVDSRRSNGRRSAWLRSTATCLNDCTNSPARWRLATSWLAASRPPSRNSSSRERRSGPAPTSFANSSHLRAKLDATVRLMPMGLFTSCATPATRPPSAASFSAAMRLCCASQVVERLLRAILGRAQLVLRLALGNGIFAKDRDRARHLADFIAGMRSLNGLVVLLGDDGVHRGHDL